MEHQFGETAPAAGPRFEFHATGLEGFNAHVQAELKKWWTKRYLAHWIPRIRFSLWLCSHLWLITKCVAEQARREAVRERFTKGG